MCKQTPVYTNLQVDNEYSKFNFPEACFIAFNFYWKNAWNFYIHINEVSYKIKWLNDRVSIFFSNLEMSLIDINKALVSLLFVSAC